MGAWQRLPACMIRAGGHYQRDGSSGLRKYGGMLVCTVSHVYPHVPVEEHWHAYVLGHDQADMMHSSSSQTFAMRNGEMEK